VEEGGRRGELSPLTSARFISISCAAGSEAVNGASVDLLRGEGVASRAEAVWGGVNA
jgi:hypothetical protein